MCNTCGNYSCGGCQQCYPSVPSTWPSCGPSQCAPAPCCPQNPPFPFDGIYTQFTRIATTPIEFFNMPVTEKIMLPSPGSGRMIIPLHIMNILKFNTLAYTDSTPATPVLRFDLGGATIATDNQILGSTGDITHFYTLSQNVFAPLVGVQCFQNINGIADGGALTMNLNLPPIVGDSVLYTYITYIIANL